MERDTRPGGWARLRLPLLAMVALMAATAGAASGSEAIIARRAVGAPAMAAARIMSGQEGGTIPLSVVALFDPQPTGASVVPVLVRVDGPALLESAKDRASFPLGIFVYAIAPSGRVVSTVSEIVQLDTGEHGECLERGGLDFVGALQLEPGEYSVRVFVRGAAGSDSGMRVVELQLPAAGDRRAALLPPMFRSRNDCCVALQQSIAEGETELPLFDVAAPPTARLALEVGERTELELLVNGLPDGEPGLFLELYDSSDRVAATLPIEVLARRPAGEGWQERLSAAIDPGDLEPGAYRMRAGWSAGSAETTVSAWLDVDLVGTTPVAAPIAPAAGTDGRRVATAAISEAYRGALVSLAQGKWSAAQAALFGLEQGTFAELGVEEMLEVAAAEDAAMRRLAESEPNGLIPVYVLHRNLHNRYRAERRFRLAQHARSRAQRAVDLFLDNAVWLQAREIGGALLANLAGDMQRVGLIEQSQTIFQRAIDTFPRQHAALMGLAASFEKRGAHGEAAELFETVVDLWPADAQAVLRLAINLKRLDRAREADRILGELIAGDCPEWVHSLACQELGSFHPQRQRDSNPESVLRQCLERSPHDEKLLLQLAFVLSSTGRPSEARELVAQKSVRAQVGQTASPRYRYSLWPSEALAANRDLVRSRAQAELAALAAGLGLEAVAP